MVRYVCVGAGCALLTTIPAWSQGYDPAPRLRAQAAAMEPLRRFEGRWRGPAWVITPTGRHQLTRTERVGPLLDRSVQVVEGRGYEADGRLSFNAFGVISYDPDTRRYQISSNAMGRSGSFPLRIVEGGYSWETPAGPGAIQRFTATVTDKGWHEVGERIAGDAKPVRNFEMTLARIGATGWPAADPVPMK